jgi:hypothetical protein
VGLIDKKNLGSKISWHLPFNFDATTGLP